MSTLQFFANAIRSPLQTGALVPSSRWLARSMVDAAGIRAGNVILELGPGTGTFTAELVSRHPGHQIVAVERSLPLARVLQQLQESVNETGVVREHSLGTSQAPIAPEVSQAVGSGAESRAIVSYLFIRQLAPKPFLEAEHLGIRLQAHRAT
ncbi:MAG: hypothetical protein J0M24_00560 [Verrucomicrobia bacterium]|nr:hypothetical protein [Verrucomicrobiota bacterium]